MSDDWGRAEIDAWYEKILRQLKGSSLYGMPADVTDMKLMVVSAYLMGQSEIRQQHLKEYENIMRLR